MRALALALSWVLWLATASQAADQRIVVVGDIHGALSSFELILKSAGLIDDDRRWIGGTDILVQTGDMLDRGAEAKEVAELLMDLQSQAAAQGGRTVVLMGNHEAMNLTMSLRDVTADMVKPFAGSSSTKKRDRYCDRVRKLERRQTNEKKPKSQQMAECRAGVPVGLLEYIDAIAADEPLGKWLRSLPIAVRIDGWLFMHGGLSPEWAKLSLDEINATARSELERFDLVRNRLLGRKLIVKASSLAEIAGVARALSLVAKERKATPESLSIPNLSPADLEPFHTLQNWLLFAPDGPLWFRGYAQWDDDRLAAEIPQVLEAQSAKGIVVGHTPRKSGRIQSRLDQRVLLIDTGMLIEVYGGRPAALEIRGDSLTAIYPDGRQTLRTPAAETH